MKTDDERSKHSAGGPAMPHTDHTPPRKFSWIREFLLNRKGTTAVIVAISDNIQATVAATAVFDSAASCR